MSPADADLARRDLESFFHHARLQTTEALVHLRVRPREGDGCARVEAAVQALLEALDSLNCAEREVDALLSAIEDRAA